MPHNEIPQTNLFLSAFFAIIAWAGSIQDMEVAFRIGASIVSIVCGIYGAYKLSKKRYD